jgi:hypothetical protein
MEVTRIGCVKSLKISEYINMVERKIFRKGAMISSWRPSSRRVNVAGVKADLLVRGNMAVKGFLFSRMWSWTVPRWETLAVVFSHRENEKAPPSQLAKLITSTEKYMSENDIKWSWLVYVSESGFQDETVELVKSRLKKEIGIMLVDLASRDFAYNRVLVNKYGIRVFKP